MAAAAHLSDLSACSGCNLCRLVCPMWRRHRHPDFTPTALLRSPQSAANAACTLCGACDAACPEHINLTGLITNNRGQTTIINRGLSPIVPIVQVNNRGLSPIIEGGARLVAGAGLRADAGLLARVEGLLGFRRAEDDGADIAWALECGAAIAPARRRRFLDGIEGRTLVVGDGLLLRALRRWLPGARLQGLGEALSHLGALRRRLTSADCYVIEARAYHADHERLVAHYARLREETGCMMNLDLQRIAIAPGDEDSARWMLRGLRPARIVVENAAEREVLRAVCAVPVLHLAELAA